MAFTQRLVYETIRSADSASAASYLVLGTPTTHNASIVKVVNVSNKDILISTDGSTNMDICPAGSFFLYDATSDKSLSTDCFIPARTQFYIKTSDGAAGTGLVYLVVLYQAQN